MSVPELVDATGGTTISGQSVTAENSKNVHTAYRCINILSDDVAKMPLQTFVQRTPGQIEQVNPDGRRQNVAWLLEKSPNRWMTPFIFKKALMTWLVTWGASYVWTPRLQLGYRREMFILPTNQVFPYMTPEGDLWYHVQFSNGSPQWIPAPEIWSVIINSTDGITGRSVISYARETIGRQLGAHETQGKFYSQGLNPGGIIWTAGEVDREARTAIRKVYEEAMTGSSNAYRLAIMDPKITKFEPITMKPIDVQFLEGIQQNDAEIANFFGVPLYKLNQGKQSYQSNEQQNMDYLTTTIDPYLVQWEQASEIKWLPEAEQEYTYFRFNRDVLLRTDSKSRAELLNTRIMSGQLSPNEARKIEDLPAYPGGDVHYVPSNWAVVGPDGSLIMPKPAQ
jgi:HK97 family phage portal protein